MELIASGVYFSFLFERKVIKMARNWTGALLVENKDSQQV